MKAIKEETSSCTWIKWWTFVFALSMGTAGADLTPSGISGLACTAAGTVGTKKTLDASSYPSGPDDNTGFSYLVEDPVYTFPCCGIISKWEFIGNKTGTLQLHVWRRMDTRTYLLIGENYCPVEVGFNKCLITKYDRILVRKGDFIGWHNLGIETLAYDSEHFNGTALHNMFKRVDIGDKFPGDVHDWSQTAAYNDRDYPIRATYERSVPPSISLNDMSVPDYLVRGRTVGRITYQDTDYMDNSSLVVVAKSSSPFYTTDLPSGYVTASNQYEPRDFDLSYYLYDLCYSNVSGSAKVTVQRTAIVIDNLDATFVLHKTRTLQERLHTITCTDPIDQWYCYPNGWTDSWPFMLKAETLTSYGFYVTEYPNFTETTYNLEITCKANTLDTTPDEQTGTIVVTITDNLPPSITNLDAYVLVDASTAIKGNTVFTVNATDPESDVVTFGPTDPCIPDGTFLMTKNGNIQLNKFLTLTPDYQFDCKIEATDEHSNTDGPYNLHISISNINHQVTIQNMPASGLQLLENMPIGTLLWTFMYHDVDSDMKSWSIQYSHDEASRYFNLDPNTGELTLAHSVMDFETISPTTRTTYTLNITVGDIKSIGQATLEVTPYNVNEAPWFMETYYTIEMDEEDDGYIVSDGSIFLNSFVDEDLNSNLNTYEAHEFYLDCDNTTNTQRFLINKDTAAITLQGDYDLDATGTPDEVSCTVTVQDKYGLSDTTKLYIHVKNVNEHAPEFTHLNYTWYLATNSLVGTFLGTVSAVDFDCDCDDDAKITYTVDQSLIIAETDITNPLLAVNNDGSVYTISKVPARDAQYTLGPVCIEASNNNGKTGNTTVMIFVPGSTTTSTTTTDRNLDFTEDKWHTYWLIASGAGIFVILLSLTLVIARICRLHNVWPWCYAWCCQPSPERPRGFGDKGYDLASFGHRHMYMDERGDIDGWEPRSKQGMTRKTTGQDDPLAKLHGNKELPRKKAVHEMFRIHNQPGYLNPHSNTRSTGSTWKKDSKPLV
ncbi:cadherin EGF LAG seven-pass G-type receptor fmi-1-like [Mya arenaria]|uniref:cadherin EGF LAG seven-pass G-type receptor fmi-1-like n=1 Tax=Mya arenaria TaxID=6604 RepID=UPI0022E2B3F5|nr:cadherin EGF LAG seven-pass G-type receptor fmi-1-like [Mya arenaria]